MNQLENNDFYASAIENSKNKSHFEFIKWFNGGKSENEIKYSGYHNFLFQIMTPNVQKEIKIFNNVLEIGVGGGRIANASSKFFNNFHGIDIHNNLEDTKGWLEEQGSTNIELKKIESCQIPYEDKKFDLIYSYIVFQHVLQIECVENYLKEIHRTLNDAGIAVVFVARPKFLWRLKRCNFFVILDEIIASIASKLGKNIYQNKKALVNHVNLAVSKSYMQTKLTKLGFDILDSGYSFRKEDLSIWGGQRKFIIRKQNV